MRWPLLLVLLSLGCRKPDPAPRPAPVVVPQKQPTIASALTPASIPAEQPGPGTQPGPAWKSVEPLNPVELEGTVIKYFNQVGSFPYSWQDMINKKVIRSVPLGKDGKPLDFRQFLEWENRGRRSD